MNFDRVKSELEVLKVNKDFLEHVSKKYKVTINIINNKIFFSTLRDDFYFYINDFCLYHQNNVKNVRQQKGVSYHLQKKLKYKKDVDLKETVKYICKYVSKHSSHEISFSKNKKLKYLDRIDELLKK